VDGPERRFCGLRTVVRNRRKRVKIQKRKPEQERPRDSRDRFSTVNNIENEGILDRTAWSNGNKFCLANVGDYDPCTLTVNEGLGGQRSGVSGGFIGSGLPTDGSILFSKNDGLPVNRLRLLVNQNAMMP